MNKRKLISLLELGTITKAELERIHMLNGARYALLLTCKVDPGAALLLPEYEALREEENKRLHTVNDEIMYILGDHFVDIYNTSQIANQTII